MSTAIHSQRLFDLLTKTGNNLPDGGGASRSESTVESALGSSLNSVRKRELDVGVVELGDVGSLAVLGSDLLQVNNLDASSTSSVATSHIHVWERVSNGFITLETDPPCKGGGGSLTKLVDGSNTGGITELLVQVVGSRSAVVSDEDTVVLHNLRSLLVDLVDSENFTSGLLHLVVFTQEIPEARLGNDIVGSEDSHAVQGGVGSILSRLETTDNLVFLEGLYPCTSAHRAKLKRSKVTHHRAS